MHFVQRGQKRIEANGRRHGRENLPARRDWPGKEEKMEKKLALTRLEGATLLKKAGIVPSLLEGRDFHLQELDGVYDPEISPEGEWDDTAWHGGPNSGGREGYRGVNAIHRVSLSNQEFVILQKERHYVNGSSFETNHERNYPDGDCGCCGDFFYIFRSQGEELDAKRITKEKLEKLLNSAEKHLPEALEMLRIEIVKVMLNPQKAVQ